MLLTTTWIKVETCNTEKKKDLLHDHTEKKTKIMLLRRKILLFTTDWEREGKKKERKRVPCKTTKKKKKKRERRLFSRRREKILKSRTIYDKKKKPEFSRLPKQGNRKNPQTNRWLSDKSWLPPSRVNCVSGTDRRATHATTRGVRMRYADYRFPAPPRDTDGDTDGGRWAWAGALVRRWWLWIIARVTLCSNPDGDVPWPPRPHPGLTQLPTPRPRCLTKPPTLAAHPGLCLRAGGGRRRAWGR